MSNKLTFVNTFTVEEFKTLIGAANKPLQPRLNPSTGKAFFTCGTKSGAIANKNIQFDSAGKPINVAFSEPVVSLVEDANGNEFFLVHDQASGGAPELGAAL